MITEKNLAQARTTTGVVAATAELRKVNEVNANYLTRSRWSAS